MRKRRCFCPRRNVFDNFVTTAFVRRRNTLPRSLLIFMFFANRLAGFLLAGGADVDDTGDVVVVDFRPLSVAFGLFSINFAFVLVFFADSAAFNDERVLRTTALAASTLRLFLKAKLVPTELIVVLLVDMTLNPRGFTFVFCFNKIFFRFNAFGKSFWFLLFGFGTRSGKIRRTALFAGKLASIR